MTLKDLEEEIYLYLEEAKVIKQIKQISTIIQDYIFGCCNLIFSMWSSWIKETMYTLNKTKSWKDNGNTCNAPCINILNKHIKFSRHKPRF